MRENFPGYDHKLKSVNFLYCCSQTLKVTESSLSWSYLVGQHYTTNLELLPVRVSIDQLELSKSLSLLCLF